MYNAKVGTISINLTPPFNINKLKKIKDETVIISIEYFGTTWMKPIIRKISISPKMIHIYQ